MTAELAQMAPNFFVINVYNGKGGTCKTSLALHLAWFLAALGFTVVLIDCDGQSNASSILPYPYREPTLTHVIRDDVPLIQAMYQARRNLYVVPSDPDLGEAVYDIGKKKNWNVMSHRLADLKAAVDCTPRPSPLAGVSRIRLRDIPTLEKPSKAEFHSAPKQINFVIFDHVPNPDELTDSALQAGGDFDGGIIIPCELEKFAMDGIPRTLLNLNKMFGTWRKTLNILGIAPINLDHSRRTTPVYLTNLIHRCGKLLLREVHTDSNVPNAQSFQETILEYERNQGLRSTRAAKEFFQIALKLAGYQGTSPDFSVCKNCQEIHELARKTPVGQPAQ
jgi:cellulose biosynthesis protein BcsQ